MAPMKVVVDGVKVLGEWRVSPPTGSVPPTELRLSYFDISMLNCQGEYLLFFDFLGSAQDFRDEHFPRLQRSLSLALTLFYPLAGRLVPSPDSNYPGGHVPVIRYSEGDFVAVTLAESGADFASLVWNQAKEAEAFHPLVPPLPLVNFSSVSTVPLMAFQVTIFPTSGFSIGMKFNHVAADGFGFIHFLKSCAAIAKAGGTDVSAVREPPVFDRAILGADREFLKRYLLVEVAAENEQRRRLASQTESSVDDPNPKPEPQTKGRGYRVTRATFMLKRAHMENLRRKMQLSIDQEEGRPRMSTFAATCAFVWVCLAKSRPVGPSTGESGPTLCFWIPANFRPRMEPPVPSSYFGNVSPVSAVVEVSHAELTGENGVATASRAIQLAILQIEEERRGGAALLEKHLISVNLRFKEVMGSKPREHRFSIAGSPMFHAYDVDFGFGRPRKIEYPSIEMTEFVSFNDSRDEEGGVEIGLGGPEEEMLRFASLFKESLELYGQY